MTDSTGHEAGMAAHDPKAGRDKRFDLLGPLRNTIELQTGA